jgi:hypothetical protein
MKNYFYTFALLLAATATAVFLSSGVDNSSGSPGGKTGSPGDGGVTCTQCHAGTAMSAEGLISSNIPAEGFIPGETYEIEVSISDDDAGRFGFELTAEDESGNKIGEFQLTDEENTRLVNSDAAVSHTFNGTSPQSNSRTWIANWMAPAEIDGNINFYTAVNVANGNGANSGDQIYTNSVSYQINDVGIEEISLVEGIYPNPATNFLNLDLAKSDLEISVYSINGKVLESFVAQGQSTTINLSEYKTGIYFVKAGNSPMQKFLVRK